jgi:hypothetical protein
VAVPQTRPLPTSGSVLVDARGGARALRVTWHPEAEMVVLSLWRDNVCAGSFRIPAADVPALISTLSAGLTPAKAG